MYGVVLCRHKYLNSDITNSNVDAIECFVGQFVDLKRRREERQLEKLNENTI